MMQSDVKALQTPGIDRLSVWGGISGISLGHASSGLVT